MDYFIVVAGHEYELDGGDVVASCYYIGKFKLVLIPSSSTDLQHQEP